MEVTINGIGARAGNASLEEVVMALKCRDEHVLGSRYTGINTRHIVMASKMVFFCELWLQFNCFSPLTELALGVIVDLKWLFR